MLEYLDAAPVDGAPRRLLVFPFLISLVLAAAPAVTPAPRCAALHAAEVTGAVVVAQCFDFDGVRERWSLVPSSRAGAFEVALLSPGRPALHVPVPSATAIVGVAFPEPDGDGRRDVLVAYTLAGGTRFLALVQWVSATTGRFERSPEGETQLKAALPPEANLAAARDAWKRLRHTDSTSAVPPSRPAFRPWVRGTCLEEHYTTMGSLVVYGAVHEIREEKRWFESVEEVEAGHRTVVVIAGYSNVGTTDGAPGAKDPLDGASWRLRCSAAECIGMRVTADMEVAPSVEEAGAIRDFSAHFFQDPLRSALDGETFQVGAKAPRIAEALQQKALNPRVVPGRSTATVSAVTDETWTFTYEMDVAYLLEQGARAQSHRHGEIIIDRRTGLERSGSDTGTYTVGAGRSAHPGHVTQMWTETEVPGTRCAEALVPRASESEDPAATGLQGGKAE